MKRGFTLVEIMIVVAIIALLAAIAIPNLLRAKMSANEAAAQATLRTYSTACEGFAADNDGNYPANEAALTAPATGPPYLNRAYDTETVQGYTYAAALATNGYLVSATAQNCGTAGNNHYNISTGGVLNTVACP